MEKIKCILLVDDDPTVIFLNSRIINKHGLGEQLLTARNGKEALSLLQQSCLTHDTPAGICPQLILLDISMPIMNGFEFLENFEKMNLRPAPLVALLTTTQNPKDKEKAKQFNVAGYLSKPLTQESLTSLITKCFNS